MTQNLMNSAIAAIGYWIRLHSPATPAARSTSIELAGSE